MFGQLKYMYFAMTFEINRCSTCMDSKQFCTLDILDRKSSDICQSYIQALEKTGKKYDYRNKIKSYYKY